MAEEPSRPEGEPQRDVPTPADADPAAEVPPTAIGPPPEGDAPALGLDDAWERLSGAGRGVVVLLAMALVIGAGVGIGLLAGSDDGGGGGDAVVLAETASSVVTVEGAPETETFEDPNEAEPVPGEAETDLVPVPVPEATETELVPVPVPEETETDLVPVPVPGETVTEGSATGELPSLTDGQLPQVPPGALAVFTSEAPGRAIGPATVAEPSFLDWGGGGEQFTLVDRASGTTLVDSSAVVGRIEIEAGEYDLEVTEAGEEWLVVITDR